MLDRTDLKQRVMVELDWNAIMMTWQRIVFPPAYQHSSGHFCHHRASFRLVHSWAGATTESPEKRAGSQEMSTAAAAVLPLLFASGARVSTLFCSRDVFATVLQTGFSGEKLQFSYLHLSSTALFPNWQLPVASSDNLLS